MAHGYSFILDRPSPTYKPSMSAHEPKITIDIGNDALLSCTGEQVMEYTRATRLFWMLNGTTLDTSAAHYNATNTFYHQEDGQTPSVEMRLRIFGIRWLDAGVYVCGVDSTLGQANDEITLTVKGNSIKLQTTLLWNFGANSEWVRHSPQGDNGSWLFALLDAGVNFGRGQEKSRGVLHR